jgi:hypothetical protein
MERYGNDTAGFLLEYAADTGMVRVECWGFWDVEVATQFGSAVRGACTNRPPGTTLSMDMTRIKPMRDEGQQSFAMVVGSTVALGIRRIVVTTGSPLVRLQLLRIASEQRALDGVDIT